MSKQNTQFLKPTIHTRDYYLHFFIGNLIKNSGNLPDDAKAYVGKMIQDAQTTANIPDPTVEPWLVYRNIRTAKGIRKRVLIARNPPIYLLTGYNNHFQDSLKLLAQTAILNKENNGEINIAAINASLNKLCPLWPFC